MVEHGQRSFLIRLLDWILGLFRSSSAAPAAPSAPERSGQHGDLDAGVTRAQVGIIRQALGNEVGVACEVEGDESTVQYLYRSGHILVPTSAVPAVTAYFGSRSETFEHSGEARHEPVEGLTLFALPPRLDDTNQPDERTLAELDAALGAGVVAPDHLLYVTACFMCPATEPNSPGRDRPWPRETRDTDRGAGVRIDVVDTGWWKQAAQDPEAPWLAYGVDGDAEQINPAAIHPYGGHGTFVAGVLRCQAPQADVRIHGMLTQGGAIFESNLMQQLDIACFGEDVPDIVSISGGTHTYNDQPLKTFEHLALKHNLINNPNAPLIVAAAGNDKTSRKFWPAAFDWVVGVGSLDTDDTVSDFSDHGDWVDIYALGRDHVNAFPTGTYTCYEPPNVGQVRQFKNLAKWSGTSFSTPLITGLIAGLMTEHGLTAHEAWLRLKADGIVRTDPRIGKILTVDTPGD